MSPPDPAPLPGDCAVAYKEWGGVCSALERGLQTVLLRKGGIDEGPAGFTPGYPAFWLYPTRLHQATQGLRLDGLNDAEAEDGRSVPIRTLAVVEWVGRVDRKELLGPLEPFHVWTPETVSARFDYRRPGLWVLAVRVYTLAEPIRVDVAPEYAGCKTWVPLRQPLPTSGLKPVLDASEFRRRLESLLSALRPPGEPPTEGD
ncbi:MAG: DUF1802 family protein [Isosphaeraceae bacterium]